MCQLLPWATTALALALGCGGSTTGTEAIHDSPLTDGGDEEPGRGTRFESGMEPDRVEGVDQDVLQAETGSDGDSGSKHLGVPKLHRAAAQMCTSDPPPPADVGVSIGSDAGSTCRINSDCVDDLNGRCSIWRSTPFSTELRCTYDECRTDADCNGGACQCGRDVRPFKHYCVVGNCRTDSDCSSGYCSPSNLFGCGAGPRFIGYYCHTAADECFDDFDCPLVGPGNGAPYCAFDSGASRWACSRINPSCWEG
jgi:hypothetical protein